MARYEVTQAEYAAVMGKNPSYYTWGSLTNYVHKQVLANAEKLVGNTQRPNPIANLNTVPILVPRNERTSREERTHPQLLTNSIGMKLVLIPAGEFDMGTVDTNVQILARFPNAEWESTDDERSQHRVRITQPFYLGRYEVTIGQFRQFVQAENYRTEAEKDGKGGYGLRRDGIGEQKPQYNWKSTGFPQSDDHSVVNVSWNDATEFCQWLSRKEGQTYRLPTEAQWEYACRAGTKKLYHHGDDPEALATVGNTADGTVKSQFPGFTTINTRDGYVTTAPVGRFTPNPFGLYDMHGNVYEWCADWYDKDCYARSPVDDPSGVPTGQYRVIRSSGWSFQPLNWRSADRFGSSPQSRGYHGGFRVHRTATAGPP
jgi:formylglycine-generating enzyme